MDGHRWSRVSESEVTTTLNGRSTSRKQWLWICDRCLATTIVDENEDPEQMPTLYGLEPKELDGTTIMEPLIPNCDEEIASKVMDS